MNRLLSHLSFFSLLTAILLGVYPAYGFSAKDIQLSNIQSPQMLYLLRGSAEYDSLTTDWQMNWPYRSISREDLVDTFQTIVLKISDRVWVENNLVVDLALATLHHKLFILGVNESYREVHRLLKELREAYPQSFQIEWLYGEHLIESGFISEGFQVLDSLHIYSLSPPQSFMESYTHLAKKAFLPHSINKTATFMTEEIQQGNFYMNASESEPVSISRDVTYDLYKKGKASAKFIFKEAYLLKPPLTLQRPLLKKQANANSSYLPDSIIQDIPTGLYWHPERVSDNNASFSILLDRQPTQKHPREVLYSMVQRKYHKIREVPLRQGVIGASVRGYNYRAGGLSQDFYAMTILDVASRGNLSRFNTSQLTEKNLPQPQQWRFVISLETKKAVEDKAEFIYESLLNQFFE